MHYRRFLLATAGCIGAGLDTDKVYLVLWDGFPISILDLVQEDMGWCGRGRSNNGENPSEKYHIMATLPNYIYLVEWLYKTDDTKASQSFISMEEQHVIALKSLHEMLHMVTLELGCWYVILEQYCACPVLHPREVSIPCHNACPHSRNELNKQFLPVRHAGLTDYLAFVFIRQPTENMTATRLVDKLKNHPLVG